MPAVINKVENELTAAQPGAGCTTLRAMCEAMVGGDEAAYREFHRQYFSRLARYLLVAARGDEQLMQDAVQETFRRVVRHIRPFGDEAVFWSWLTVLARTSLVDERRRSRRYLAFLDRFRAYSCPPDAAPEPEDQASILLERELAKLAREDRAILEAKYFEGISVRAIAAAFGTTEASIESRLVRIRRKLKSGIIAAMTHEQTSI